MTPLANLAVGGAFVLSVGACLYSCYSGSAVREMRRAQDALAEQVRSLDGRLARATASPHPGRLPAALAEVEPVSEEAAAAGGPGPAAPELHADSPLSVRALESILDRYAGLGETARREAVGDLAVFSRWGDPRARDALVATLVDPSERIREKAVGEIAKLGDPALAHELEPLLRDPSPKVRRRVAKALEALASPSAGPMLLRLLDDDDPKVVSRAVEAIGEIGYREGRFAVAPLARHEEIGVVAVVGRTLMKLGDERGADDIVERIGADLQSDDPSERRRVLKYVGQIGGERALDYLERGLRDADPRVRAEAEKRLVRLGAP